MKEVFRVIERVAADDDTVLVRGETGAGKELVAGAIHALSTRRKGPLRVINCAALPSNLLESELFGHVRGSFTGAHRDTPGHIQLAHKGTLFLDEIAELPLEVQAKHCSDREKEAFLVAGQASGKRVPKDGGIQRYKGLGEMDYSELWATTMDPEQRTLLQVTMDDAAAADEIFSILMGEDVESRRSFIQRNAKDVRFLDI